MENKIPTIWRQAKIIAILKPGKDSSIPKNYRPISLLWHTYKLYERMILNRIAPAIEQHLINEQAGFTSGKSCTSQPLNITQHIEDGYEEGMITGTACVDLSAAYDTVNHRLLIQKLYNTTLDSQLCRVIQNLMSDRGLYVELNNERSRWRIQKNGLPQGSVLSPTLFNIYRTINMCITAQYPTFQEVEQKIEEALGELTHYYRSNSVRIPTRRKSRCFICGTERPRSRYKHHGISIGDLENTDTPKYKGVTLYRTLSYKTHIHNTKMKVANRNNLLKKLANSRWGTNARTIKTTTLALYYSTAEYATPVWKRSAYAHLLNLELNQACRAITGCLKPTNVEILYLLAGIAPPEIRISVCARVERIKQVERETHSLFGHTPARSRLMLRIGCITSVQPVHFPAKVVRVSKWKKREGTCRLIQPVQGSSHGAW